MIASATIQCPWCGTAHQAPSSHCAHCGVTFPQTMLTIQNQLLRPYRFHRLLRQRYLILRLVGMGNLGVVYEALDIDLYRHVAVKELRPASLTSQSYTTAYTLFQDEVTTLARCDHPGLPKVYDHFEESGHFYSVEEFVWGQTLATYLSDLARNALSLKQILSIGIQLCAVLEYLHTLPSPLLVRNLRPASILFTPTGKIYVIDVGMRQQSPADVHHHPHWSGVTEYTAPECAVTERITPRADLYSLGAILSRLITGEAPSPRLSQFAPLDIEPGTFPFDLARLITHLVHPDPTKRPESASVVRKALEKALSDLRI